MLYKIFLPITVDRSIGKHQIIVSTFCETGRVSSACLSITTEEIVAALAKGILMNGLQVERMLDFIEERSDANRPLIRREINSYLKSNLQRVADALIESGEAVIPTNYGAIKLTKDDLAKIGA